MHINLSRIEGKLDLTAVPADHIDMVPADLVPTTMTTMHDALQINKLHYAEVRWPVPTGTVEIYFNRGYDALERFLDNFTVLLRTVQEMNRQHGEVFNLLAFGKITATLGSEVKHHQLKVRTDPVTLKMTVKNSITMSPAPRDARYGVAYENDMDYENGILDYDY